MYDRFGRLIHGNPYVAKDVLEYVVFEKHLANVYGHWRIHGKIIPDWMPEKEPGRLTHAYKTDIEPEEVQEEKEEVKFKEQDEGEKDENVVYDRFGKTIKE